MSAIGDAVDGDATEHNGEHDTMMHPAEAKRIKEAEDECKKQAGIIQRLEVGCRLPVRQPALLLIAAGAAAISSRLG